jgi:hypothetical protein
MKPKNGREWSLAPLTDADHSDHCSHVLAPPLSNAIGMRWCVFVVVCACVCDRVAKEVGEGTDCTTTWHALSARGLRARVKAARSCRATLLKAPSCAIPCVRISRLRLRLAGKVRLCDNKSVFRVVGLMVTTHASTRVCARECLTVAHLTLPDFPSDSARAGAKSNRTSLGVRYMVERKVKEAHRKQRKIDK